MCCVHFLLFSVLASVVALLYTSKISKLNGVTLLGNARDAVAGATLFLIFMACFHIVGRNVELPWKLPFLAYSNALWDYIKIGIYASTIAYAALWAVRGKGNLVGLASAVIATAFSLFVYAYTLTSIVGIPVYWKYSLANVIGVTLANEKVMTLMGEGATFALTWFSGLSGIFVGLKSEIFGDSDALAAVALVNYALLIWLTVITTYFGSLPSLFSSGS